MTTSFATAAAKTFLERHPAYVVCPENSKIMSAEVIRLVDEGADPANVATYERAFSNCLADLKLNEPPQSKSLDEMDGAELSALPDKKKDLLPDHLLKRLANYELQQRRKRPEPSEADLILRPLFAEEGSADSTKNRAIIGGWLNKRSLGYSLSNLSLAIEACSEHLEPSAQALEEMSGDEYRKSIVEPEFARKLAAQAKQPRHERGNPPGFSYVSWLHGQ
jgi:hypothetical protein